MYREGYLVTDLGWVDNYLDCSTTILCCYVNTAWFSSATAESGWQRNSQEESQPMSMFHPVRVSIFRKETEYDHVSRTIPSPEIRPYHRGLQGIAARAARVGGRLSGRLSPSTTLTSASRDTSWSTTRMTVGNRRMRILITSDSDLNHYSWLVSLETTNQ